ncbi:MAG TPA: hypothetical protein VFQ45_22685, partial [Longimicrobium sp.]|nr:hypothetical protein [Longimicrobium sp.]
MSTTVLGREPTLVLSPRAQAGRWPRVALWLAVLLAVAAAVLALSPFGGRRVPDAGTARAFAAGIPTRVAPPVRGEER